MDILLVGDDLEDQNIVNATLHEAGFTVFPVNDGLSGLDVAIADKPALIIVDSRLPGMDVVHFIKRIRRRDFLEKTPILLLVREADYDPIFLESIGIQAYVNKPIDPAVLSKEVMNQIGSPPQRRCPWGQEETPVSQTQSAGTPSNAVLQAFEKIEVDELLRKSILDVVEKVAWDVVPGVIETALPREAVHAIVERVVWETVPSLAEIEIKKEIQRLQSEE